jgi:hypothetical protein
MCASFASTLTCSVDFLDGLSRSYDLLVACKEIGEGKREAPELLGDVVIKPILASDAYETKLDSTRVVSNDHVRSLLQRYAARKAKFEESSAVEYQI